MNSIKSGYIELDEARKMTDLPLVSAAETLNHQGLSYQALEEKAESTAHADARLEAQKYFISRGFVIYPQGIGIEGVYTLADFLAIRGERVIFVEVLTDSALSEETLRRKLSLQEHAELCFIFLYGNKIADSSQYKKFKERVENLADVLYCRINGWSGNFIRDDNRMSVAFDTTRARGIIVELQLSAIGKNVELSTRFVTHLYVNPMNTLISYSVSSPSYQYELIWLSVFRNIESITKRQISCRSKKTDSAIRSIRSKAGLIMRGANEKIALRLRSRYLGNTDTAEQGMWNHHPASRDLAPEDFYGVFVAEATGPEVIVNLTRAFEIEGIKLVLASPPSREVMAILTKQKIV